MENFPLPTPNNHENQKPKDNGFLRKAKMTALGLVALGVTEQGIAQNNKKGNHKIESKTEQTKAQEKVPPYITYDMDDVRIQQYKDSLRRYEHSDALWKSSGKLNRFGMEKPFLSREEVENTYGMWWYNIERREGTPYYFVALKKDSKKEPQRYQCNFYYEHPKQEVIYSPIPPIESVQHYKEGYTEQVKETFGYFNHHYTSQKTQERAAHAGLSNFNEISRDIHKIMNDWIVLSFENKDGSLSSYPDSLNKDKYVAKEYTIDNKLVFYVPSSLVETIPKDAVLVNKFSYKIISENRDFISSNKYKLELLEKELELKLDWVQKYDESDEVLRAFPRDLVNLAHQLRQYKEDVVALKAKIEHLKISPIQELIDKDIEIANKYQKGNPYDFIADINTLRYELQKAGIYDSGKEDFTSHTLHTIKKNHQMQKNPLLKKLLKQTDSKDNFIKAMNEII